MTFALCFLLHHLYQTFWHPAAMAFVQSANAAPHRSALQMKGTFSLLIWDYRDEMFPGLAACFDSVSTLAFGICVPLVDLTLRLLSPLVDLTSTNFWTPVDLISKACVSPCLYFGWRGLNLSSIVFKHLRIACCWWLWTGWVGCVWRFIRCKCTHLETSPFVGGGHEVSCLCPREQGSESQ